MSKDLAKITIINNLLSSLPALPVIENNYRYDLVLRILESNRNYYNSNYQRPHPGTLDVYYKTINSIIEDFFKYANLDIPDNCVKNEKEFEKYINDNPNIRLDWELGFAIYEWYMNRSTFSKIVHINKLQNHLHKFQSLDIRISKTFRTITKLKNGYVTDEFA